LIKDVNVLIFKTIFKLALLPAQLGIPPDLALRGLEIEKPVTKIVPKITTMEPEVRAITRNRVERTPTGETGEWHGMHRGDKGAGFYVVLACRQHQLADCCTW